MSIEVEYQSRASEVHSRLMGSQPKAQSLRSKLHPVIATADPDVVEVQEPRQPHERWKQIVFEVCRKHGLTYDEIMGHQRSVRIAIARHEAFYRLATETTSSLPRIGKWMGGKDHTSVLHGIRRHRQRMKDALAIA
jgi:chromosomal replication initiation ATPase DnaA